MHHQTLLITGANRGIGYELTRQYLEKGHRVIATCREIGGSEKLKLLAERFGEKLMIELMDIVQIEQIESLSSRLSSNNIQLDLIISNAGYLDRDNKSIHSINYQNAEMGFKVNALGPLFLIHQLLYSINNKSLSKIIVITSAMSSLSHKQQSDWYGYRMSKAAANMLVVNLAEELDNENIIVAALHPGWVQTDMGGMSATENVEDSVRGLITVIDNLSTADSGYFYSFDGSELTF